MYGDVLDEDGAKSSGEWLKTDVGETPVDQSIHEILKKRTT